MIELAILFLYLLVGALFEPILYHDLRAMLPKKGQSSFVMSLASVVIVVFWFPLLVFSLGFDWVQSLRSGRLESPKPGERFRHFKGGTYEVYDLAMNEEKRMMVYYFNVETKEDHERDLSEWLSNVEVDGVIKKRFVKIKNGQ